MRYRIIYAVLWLLTVVAYSMPWASIDGEMYTGWSFTLPFSFTYLIGILIGLVVLITKFKPIAMTIIAGILMILGLVGASLGYGLAAALAGIMEAKVTTEAGMGFAFIAIILYMIVGAYAGKKMVQMK